MNTRHAAAWDQIRAADPMNAIDVTGASEAPAAQDLLRRITTGDPHVADHSDADDVLTGLDHEPDPRPGPHRRRLAAGLVAAVVVVLAVAAVTTVWRHQRSSTTASPNRQTTAAGYAKALLAELPLPAGARRADHAPIPELAEAPYRGGGILDAQVTWWILPGALADRVAQFGRASLPAHWKISASSTGGAGKGSHGWDIEVRDPHARFVASVTVAMAEHGQTVGMLAQVDTFAVPVRTPAQIIPVAADSATFTFTGGGGSYSSQLSLTLNGPQVTTLARQVNATPTFVMLTVASCPPSSGSVTVTFRSGPQRWSLNVNNGSFSCNTPSLTGSSGPPIDLTPSMALLTDVLTAAGLPSNYFDR